MCRPYPWDHPRDCMFKRKQNAVSSKAQMNFSDKKMEPLRLLAESLATHPENIHVSQTAVASAFCQKHKIWSYEYENANRIMGLMHKAATFP